MSNKNANKNEDVYIIREGPEVKGGLNTEPRGPRPSQPPKGQRPASSTQSQKK